MRAQLFEGTLNNIVKEIDAHLGDGLDPTAAQDRKTVSDDRTLLAKIRRMAAKATER